MASALLLLQATETAFRQPSGNDAAPAFPRHAEFAAAIDELHRQRNHFRAAAALILKTSPDAITVSQLLDRLPAPDRSILSDELTRVRQMADEVAANNRRISIFARVHLDAYQRILRDLTNSHRGSGRYGSTGNAESPEYRPLIQIHG